MNDTQSIASINSLDILQELDLMGYYQEEMRMNGKKQYQFSFSSVNMAEQPILIEELFKIIRSTPHLMPPRTGHIGNWNDILEGYISHRNDNTVICNEQKLGYPLIYDLTQTEDELMQNGDLTYLPGSIVEQGKRTKLSLYTWDGTNFVERTREHPLFVPFVLTNIDGKLLPLTQVHRERLGKYKDINFQMYSSIIFNKKELVKQILIALIDDMLTKDNPEHELKFIIDRFVTLDGQMYRSTLNIINKCFNVGNTTYEDTSAFVDAILYPYEAAAAPEAFFSTIHTMPENIPLLSNHLSIIFSSIFHSHFPGYEAEYSMIPQPCYAPIQWGGIVMAGYPPANAGYFSRQIRYIRSIYKQIIRHFENLSPIFYILLPSSIFLLWPSDACKKDVELVGQLIDRIVKKSELLSEMPKVELYSEIKQQVVLWLCQVQQQLSDAFIGRFTGNVPSALAVNGVPLKSRSLEPEGFSRLTVQQAAMLVSALFETLSE